jgi:glycolate oxidase iron-sulfur subunit
VNLPAGPLPPDPARPAAGPGIGAGTVDPLVALADRCVQCGLCLPVCPTYQLDRLEPESPRGRIALARGWALGLVAPDPAGEAHLDQCLGCRNCEAVCPAGVEYGALLVAARARQRTRRAPGLRQRGLEALAARPRSMAVALAIYRALHPLLPAAWRPLPRPPGAAPRRVPAPPSSPSARPGGTAEAALFRGCVAGPYESGLRVATARLCAAVGVDLVEPAGQGCCGALHAHAGDVAAAARLAARNTQAFAGARRMLTLASGCHEAVAGAMPAGTVAQDAIAFLAGHAEKLPLRECRERVALHLPCTQRNVVRSADATRALLARVPRLEVIELDAGFGCCGAAGAQMATDPARAAQFREPLLAQLAASGATRLLSANIGCRLHFANAAGVPVQHPLDFLGTLLP